MTTLHATASATAPPRSYLFVPGDRPDRFDKAWASAADAVILDLEDAVGVAHKAEARAAVAAWLSPERPCVLRINAADTAWHADDLELLRHPGVAALMLPKAEQIDPALVQLCVANGQPLLPIVESARGFSRLEALAATPSVARLVFGSIDFQVDLGIPGDDDALLYFRSQIVLASRLAGLQPPVDGVTTAIGDHAVLGTDTERARRLGFGGKLCIHPAQVPTVNALFSPGAVEVAWAERVVAAIAASNGAAVAVDGKMVDRPVILKAERLLDSRARRARPGQAVG
ncbi:MAG: Citrate lyase subunit beta / citryl-CoA lyase [Rhodoferax sp.]|nr:Citrate lyase subunit beta / citryl-CoA lyase [Rhodoferax sp.]